MENFLKKWRMRILSVRIFSKFFGGKISHLNRGYHKNKQETKNIKLHQNLLILNMRLANKISLKNERLGHLKLC